jgi:hypothetical protein
MGAVRTIDPAMERMPIGNLVQDWRMVPQEIQGMTA